jgi:hypothetical protein
LHALQRDGTYSSHDVQHLALPCTVVAGEGADDPVYIVCEDGRAQCVLHPKQGFPPSLSLRPSIP